MNIEEYIENKAKLETVNTIGNILKEEITELWRKIYSHQTSPVAWENFQVWFVTLGKFEVKVVRDGKILFRYTDKVKEFEWGDWIHDFRKIMLSKLKKNTYRSAISEYKREAMQNLSAFNHFLYRD